MVDGINASLMLEDVQSFYGFILKNSSTCNPDSKCVGTWLPTSVDMVRGVCLAVISLLGASLNIFIILAIVPNRRMRSVRNVLLLHLGVVGLLSSVFTTMYPALAIFHGRWLGGEPMCQTYTYISWVFTSVSVWTIAALSYDKYQIITCPLHHSLTATLRKMLPCFSVFWICGLALSLPPLVGSNEFLFHSSMSICGVNSSSTASRCYTFFLVCLSFVFPFCLMMYCYAHIFRIARTQSSRIAATMLRMVSLIQAPITPSSNSSLSVRGTKALGTILQLIGSFVLTYLPYVVIILYEVIFSLHANAILVSIATTFFLAAPFTHAIIYGIRNQLLRSSFHRFIRRKTQHWCTTDKRRGSVKSLTNKSSAAFNMPMKCLDRNIEKQCILSRSKSCRGNPLDIQAGAFENKATALSRIHSFYILDKTNGWSITPFHETALENIDKVDEERKQVKDVSFSDIDDVTYINPDLMSHAVQPYYSKKIANEITALSWELEEMSKYEPEKEHSLLDYQLGDESSSDTREEELLKLCPVADGIVSFDLRKFKKRTCFSKINLHMGMQ